MRNFKTLDSVRDARDLSPNVAACIRKVIADLVANLSTPGRPYNPDDDGFCVLLEPHDRPADWQRQFGTSPDKILWEGVTYDRYNATFCAVMAYNNETCVTLCAPDAPWLDPAARQHFLDNMSTAEAKAVPPAGGAPITPNYNKPRSPGPRR